MRSPGVSSEPAQCWIPTLFSRMRYAREVRTYESASTSSDRTSNLPCGFSTFLNPDWRAISDPCVLYSIARRDHRLPAIGTARLHAPRLQSCSRGVTRPFTERARRAARSAWARRIRHQSLVSPILPLHPPARRAAAVWMGASSPYGRWQSTAVSDAAREFIGSVLKGLESKL